MIEKSRIFIISQIIIGFLIVSYILYIRLFVVKLPKELYFMNGEDIRYTFIIFSFFNIILMLYLTYKNLLIILQKENKANILSKFLTKINLFIENSLIEFYYFIMEKIPNIYDKVSYMSQKYYLIFKNKTEALLLLIVYGIKIIIIIAFFIDIFIFFKFNYMYKSLFLLLIPLLINVIIFILKDFSRNLSEISSYLIIEDNGIDDVTQLPITTYSLKESDSKIDLDYTVEQYILCSKIFGYLENYDKYNLYLSPRVNIFIYFFYLIGWFFIIYKNITLIFV